MSDQERDLRDALRARAGAVEVGRPDEQALVRRLAAARRRRNQGRVAAAALGLVVVLGAASLFATGDDQASNVVAGPDGSSTTVAELPTSAVDTTVAVTTAPPTSAPGASAPTTTGSTVPKSTSTAPPSTGPKVTVPVDTNAAVWPTASGPVYTTAVAAAQGFAVDFVGFRSPVVGAARAGSSGATEVDVRPRANGPVTTVILTQLGGGRWFVLSSITPNIVVAEPAPGVSVASPVRLTGLSTAFEATVNVEVRQDGAREPIGEGFVMGGSNGEKARFDDTVTFRRPTAKAGAIVLLTYSAEDGQVWEASTVRVLF